MLWILGVRLSLFNKGMSMCARVHAQGTRHAATIATSPGCDKLLRKELFLLVRVRCERKTVVTDIIVETNESSNPVPGVEIDDHVVAEALLNGP
jgi:hypothetical protein